MVRSANSVKYEERRSGASDYPAIEREFRSESGGLPNPLLSVTNRLHHCD